MSKRRPLDAVEALRDTRRSMGDGTMQGRVRVATPARSGSLRRGFVGLGAAGVPEPNTGGPAFGGGETVSYTTDGPLTIGTTPVAIPLDTVDELTLAGRLIQGLGGTTAHRFATRGYKTVTVGATSCPVRGEGLLVVVKVNGEERVRYEGAWGTRLDPETLRIGNVGPGDAVSVELSTLVVP